MRRSMLLTLVAAPAVTASLLAAPSATGSSPPVPAAAPDRLSWTTCPPVAGHLVSPALECTTLRVPLDYSKPRGTTIDLAISRLPSTDPAKRRGVLLTNSGGPGGVGLTFPLVLATGGASRLPLPAQVRERYDVIGIDPRGVGHSTPVTCDFPKDYYSTFAPYARTKADVAEQARRSSWVASRCGSSATSSLLPHITTANTARDLDRVRIALGERRASYLGISYGSYLGAVYASMFPSRTDRVVIDSVLSPGGWDYPFQRRIARGFEERFPDFAAFVAARPELGLGTTTREVERTYFELAGRLDATPAADGTDGARFRQTTFALLYYDSAFPTLAEIWRAVDRGRTQAPAPRATAARSAEEANYFASQLAVICNDSAFPTSREVYERNVRKDKRRFPMFGGATANITPCAFWPTAEREPKVEINDRGPANVLMSQNLRDPATPVQGAREMRRALGDRARMVTADQGGHLAYLWGTNTCLNDTVTRFLTTGQRPRHDRTCEAR